MKPTEMKAFVAREDVAIDILNRMDGVRENLASISGILSNTIDFLVVSDNNTCGPGGDYVERGTGFIGDSHGKIDIIDSYVSTLLEKAQTINRLLGVKE